jgi:hypothetical protein
MEVSMKLGQAMYEQSQAEEGSRAKPKARKRSSTPISRKSRTTTTRKKSA